MPFRFENEECEMSEMSVTTKKYGVLVCVDGSAASDAAIAWGAREAAMRHMPITLLHAVAPVVVGWPVGQLYTEMPDWQKTRHRRLLSRLTRR
jgi:nucleotide-binding universal stress UspA family protein